jgi:hypothetical protein
MREPGRHCVTRPAKRDQLETLVSGLQRRDEIRDVSTHAGRG